MGEGGDVCDDNVSSDIDICNDGKAKCEDQRKWKKVTNV